MLAKINHILQENILKTFAKPQLLKLTKLSLFFFCVSLPVIAYVWRFAIVNRNGIFHGEDWDEFAQMYEAARITIVHYHQFPWWNAWSVGGEPLFGNPQFGLFSIPMLLVLVFGTVVGLHLSIAVYFLLGFWGMYRLLKRLGSSLPIRVLLSYIWVFSGFPVWHLNGGHFTFAVYLLAPWVFLSLLNIRRRQGWIWFGLLIALILNTAIHYMTIQLAIITAILALYELLRYMQREQARLLEAVRPYLKAICIILILSLPKILYTLQFVHEFPRLDALDDTYVPLSMFVTALSSRQPVNPNGFFMAKWSWAEYADYIGIITLILVSYVTIQNLLNLRKLAPRNVLLMCGMLLAAILYLGTFAKFSPYHILHHLPFFNQMRVPSRYIAWFVLGAIVLIRQLPKRKLIYLLLAISVVDVFTANFGILNYQQQPYIAPRVVSSQFEQYAYWGANGAKDLMSLNALRLLKATQSNYGEVYGYEPTLGMGEYYASNTIRCGINQGCNFIMSHNATLVTWSPDKIVLKRTKPGPIELSMNPGKVWKIDDKSPFKHYKILAMNQPFIITDPATNIVVRYTPNL